MVIFGSLRFLALFIISRIWPSANLEAPTTFLVSTKVLRSTDCILDPSTNKYYAKHDLIFFSFVPSPSSSPPPSFYFLSQTLGRAYVDRKVTRGKTGNAGSSIYGAAPAGDRKAKSQKQQEGWKEGKKREGRLYLL